MDEMIHLIMIYGALLVGTVILNYMDEYPSVYLSKRLTEQLKIMALAKIAKIDYQAYQNVGTGQMIKVIENGAEAGNEIIYGFTLKHCMNSCRRFCSVCCLSPSTIHGL